MAHSDSSSVLSDPPPSDEEAVVFQDAQPKIKLNVQKTKKQSLKQSTLSFGGRRTAYSESPEPPLTDLNREPSPPHDDVLADNPDIAVIVMFQNRFNDCFLKGVPNLGPQDIEHGVASDLPSEQVEDLLCGLLGLVLNRKKNPERGHYGRALEEALATQKHQWPPHWNGINPIPSSKTFALLDTDRRIDFLKTLVHWSLTASEAVANNIRESYKQSRREDDMNQPLAVHMWGTDSLKRKFYLVQGHTDTPIRVYREGDRKKSDATWQSVAGDIADIQRLSRNLRAEKSQAAHMLAKKMTDYIPQMEEREDKRKRREYRVARKAQFARPDPGFSLYEGRTRGKRPRYTYDDDEIYGTDSSTRRSARQSGVSTPAEGPRYTASGRQVKSAFGTSFGEPSRLRDSVSSGDLDSSGLGSRRDGRPTRSGRLDGRRGASYDEGYESVNGLNDDGDSVTSGEDWNGDDEGGPGGKPDEDDNDSLASSEDSFMDETQHSLIVTLKCGHRLGDVNGVSTTASADLMDIDHKSISDMKSKVTAVEVKPDMDLSDVKKLPLSPHRVAPNGLTGSPEQRPPTFSNYMYNKPAIPATDSGFYQRPVVTETPAVTASTADVAPHINSLAVSHTQPTESSVNGLGSNAQPAQHTVSISQSSSS